MPNMTKVPNMRKTAALALWLALAAMLLLASVPSLEAASSRGKFLSAWKDFHALVKNERKGKYRSFWLDLEKRFMDVYKRSPGSTDAPKALYYAARANEELGKRSFLRSDFQKSVAYYERALSRFPSHGWADDCLYRKAYIEWKYLKDPSRARADLDRLLKEHPKGDMVASARKLRREIPGSRVTKKARTVRKTSSTSTIKGRVDNRLLKVRHQSSDDYTRIVLDLDKEAPFKFQMLNPDPKLKKPYRLYVDLEGTRVGDGVAPEVKVADGILRRVRSAQFRTDTTRVVLDFQDLQKYNVFALANPFRIVIDVSAADKKAVAEARKRKAAQLAAAAKAGDQPDMPLPAGSKSRAGELIEQLGLSIGTIMIDPGHGGKDPGALGSGGLREKNVNLRFAKMLGGMLQKKGFKVLYTRTKDVFIPLEERTAMANVQKADLFISIHCNAHKSRKINGFETYYLNLASNKDAVRVAARENAVTTKRISDLQFILTDLMLSSKMKESKDLALLVHSGIITGVQKHYTIKDHGVRTAPFYVLMGAKMPAILVELGYLTNPTERKRLNSKSYLTRQARALVEGIVAYKRKIERFASL